MFELPQGQPVPLWSGLPPCSLNLPDEVLPSLRAFYPAFWKKNGKAVIVFPGGGYRMLCQHEGTAYAEFLADHGYTAIVCDYRVCTDEHPYHHPAMLSDAARAVRVIRSHAQELGIDPHKIGVMGSSAGGHLAASCATFHELGIRESDESQEKDLGRPDFTILCYPVISMEADIGHAGSTQCLLGNAPAPQLIEQLTMYKSADGHTPPAFLFHTWGDSLVSIKNSLLYAARLRDVGVPCDLHLYERGDHGIGLCGGHPWTQELLRWLEQR